LAAADPAVNPKPDAAALLAEQRLLLDDILGVEQSKNVCLIDPHQMVNATDLPGRLVVLSEDPKVSAETLRYCFRVKSAKVTTQADQLQPVRCTRLEISNIKSASLLNWIGGKVEANDLAEIRTTPLPAASMSVDDLDEEQIQSKLGSMTPETRRGLGIILSVIPYEAYASVCKRVSNTRDIGVWYIRVNNSWYAKNTDEVRRHYLVAVCTPVAFYEDLGVFKDMKSMTDFPPTPAEWQPSRSAVSRSAQLREWNRDRRKASLRGSPGVLLSEQKVAL
jgi:hypothetical protein